MNTAAMTEAEVRQEYLKLREKVCDKTATFGEARYACDLIDAMIKFQKVRDHEPKWPR